MTATARHAAAARLGEPVLTSADRHRLIAERTERGWIQRDERTVRWTGSR